MIYKKSKKGLVKLISFLIIMIILSSGLGIMLVAQEIKDSVVEDFYNTSVTAEREARINSLINPVDFRDYTTEINIVIISMLAIFVAYSMWSSYVNTINTVTGVLNFLLLIVILAASNYLVGINTFIYSMPLFNGITLPYSGLNFYFNNVGMFNLGVGILISILTLIPKNRGSTNIGGLG